MGTRRGDDYDEFFRSVFPRAVRAAARVAGGTGVAEEAAMEAMVRAFVRWPRVGSLPYREAWVLRTAINEALGASRRGQRTWDGADRSGGSGGPTEDQALTRMVVATALSALPRRQREAVALRYLGDLSEADTAAALGVSGGALKSHLDRARRSLRRALGPETSKELTGADG